MVVVGFKKGATPLNEELINESYLSLDLEELLKEMEKRARTAAIKSGRSKGS